MSADRDLHDKNLVGSLVRFAKTSGSRDSVDSILTHVYPYSMGGVGYFLLQKSQSGDIKVFENIANYETLTMGTMPFVQV